MAVQTRQILLALYFTIFFSLFSSYNTLKEGPPSSFNNHNNYFEEVVGGGGYDPQAYPSYFSTIIEDGNFKDLIRPRTEILSLQRFGITSTSAKTVNVDDFGATADGTDDTQVITTYLKYFFYTNFFNV